MRGLSALCCALLLTACATVRQPRPFDPTTFLKALTPTGEGTCRLSNGAKIVFVPCKSFEGQDGSTYVALYHPQLHYLLAIKEMKIDGTQANVWNRPQPQRVVPVKGTSA